MNIKKLTIDFEKKEIIINDSFIAIDLLTLMERHNLNIAEYSIVPPILHVTPYHSTHPNSGTPVYYPPVITSTDTIK